MDAYLAIVSRREIRAYDDRPIPDEVVERVLQAGRVAGSSQNLQRWRFLVVSEPAALDRLAQAVFAPANVSGAALAIAIVVPEQGRGQDAFDAGRAAQNMMLGAHAYGVGGCPNGIADRDGAAAALGHGDDERVAIVLSFGYPTRGRDPESRPAEEWVRRAARKPFDDVVERVGGPAGSG